MFKYFAKFRLTVHNIYLYHRSRYSSTTTDRNKATYLDIKAGLLQISAKASDDRGKTINELTRHLSGRSR